MPRTVQELLGHAWVTTTQRYTHLEVEDLRAQVADLPSVGQESTEPRVITDERGLGGSRQWLAERNFHV